jgi:hypothetical protein
MEGVPMGLNMKEKQAVTREYQGLYQKAAKKAKPALLDEFTRLTGCHRKSAVRLLYARPVKPVMVYAGGKAVKLKPEKKRPANRKGKRVYTDEVLAALRLVRTFFWFKCGRTAGSQILAPLMRQQMPYIAGRPAFNITPGIAEKLKTISPAAIDRRLKKDKDALRLKGKSLTKPLHSLKSRIPDLLHQRGAEKARFPANRHRRTSVRHHCGQAAFGQYVHTLTAADVASGWGRTFSPKTPFPPQ